MNSSESRRTRVPQPLLIAARYNTLLNNILNSYISGHQPTGYVEMLELAIEAFVKANEDLKKRLEYLAATRVPQPDLADDTPLPASAFSDPTRPYPPDQYTSDATKPKPRVLGGFPMPPYPPAPTIADAAAAAASKPAADSFIFKLNDAVELYDGKALLAGNVAHIGTTGVIVEGTGLRAGTRWILRVAPGGRVPQPDAFVPPVTIPFNLLDHLAVQREFSEKTFGPGPRTAGIIDHIQKELNEIWAAPTDLMEWIDVAILAFDGAWRAGHSPKEIVHALDAKLKKNMARTWPDWRTAKPGKAIQHVKPQPDPDDAIAEHRATIIAAAKDMSAAALDAGAASEEVKPVKDTEHRLHLQVQEGKYTVIQDMDGGLRILRYGQEWINDINLPGTKCILSMGYELEELRKLKQEHMRVLMETAKELGLLKTEYEKLKAQQKAEVR